MSDRPATSPEGPSPVGTVPVIADAEDGRSRAVVTVPPSEGVFAGHYPGTPILPGVCVVEYVRLAVLHTLSEEAGPLRLAAIESCRFLRLIRPGEQLTIDWEWANGGTGRCCAVIRTGAQVAARVRLIFEAPEERPWT